eukprot:12881856-Prorocentrum_lima.AAC.1
MRLMWTLLGPLKSKGKRGYRYLIMAHKSTERNPEPLKEKSDAPKEIRKTTDIIRPLRGTSGVQTVRAHQ